MPPERDLKAQGAILDELFYERESPPTLTELENAVRDEVTLSEDGAVRWAVEDLVEVGLLKVKDGLLHPTLAAVHFHMICRA